MIFVLVKMELSVAAAEQQNLCQFIYGAQHVFEIVMARVSLSKKVGLSTEYFIGRYLASLIVSN